MPTMPNCVGLEYEDALTAMVTAGVRVLPLGYFQTDPVTISFTSTSANPAVVTAQNPASGATGIVANSAVQLTCGQFPMSVAYPAGNTNV